MSETTNDAALSDYLRRYINDVESEIVTNASRIALTNFINVKDNGAVGDGITDDYAAIAATTLALIALGGGTLYFPKGVYRMSAALTILTSEAIRLIGDGWMLSSLQFYSGGNGIDITFTNINKPPVVANLSSVTEVLGAGSGIKITGPVIASSTIDGPLVEGVREQGFITALTCWAIGIELIDCWYPKLTNITIKGQDDATTPFVQTAGVKATRCQTLSMLEVDIFHCQSGLLQGDTTHGEGLFIVGGEWVGVDIGVDWTSYGSPSSPGTYIGGLHVNAYTSCIKFKNHSQMTITGCLLYKTHISNEAWIGINSVSGNSRVNITNNTIQSSPTATGVEVPIQLSDFNDSVVMGNQIGQLAASNIGILVGTISGNNIISHNLGDSTILECVHENDDALNTNHISENYPQ